jgi:hypothetical protein
MVREAGAAPSLAELNALPEPTWGLLLQRGLPLTLVEGIVPLSVFYAVWRTVGLGPAIVVGTALSLAICWWEARRGHSAALAAVSAGFIVVQAVVALAMHSGTVYLARPIAVSFAWGIGYIVSVLVHRPLIGVFAELWYPFPRWFCASRPFRAEFGMQSLVWGAMYLMRAAAGLLLLLAVGSGAFLAFSFVTGLPATIALVVWGLWHARRRFSGMATPTHEDESAQNRANGQLAAHR